MSMLIKGTITNIFTKQRKNSKGGFDDYTCIEIQKTKQFPTKEKDKNGKPKKKNYKITPIFVTKFTNKVQDLCIGDKVYIEFWLDSFESSDFVKTTAYIDKIDYLTNYKSVFTKLKQVNEVKASNIDWSEESF